MGEILPSVKTTAVRNFYTLPSLLRWFILFIVGFFILYFAAAFLLALASILIENFPETAEEMKRLPDYLILEWTVRFLSIVAGLWLAEKYSDKK